MGYLVERRQFGFYRSSPYLPGWINVTVRDVRREDLHPFIADLRQSYPEHVARIFLDHPVVDAELGPGLIGAGCSLSAGNVYLAHRGPIPPAPDPPDFSIEMVDQANLREFVETEHRAFVGEESQPTAAELAQEMALRTAEMSGSGRFALARWGTEAAAVLDCYEAPDRLIFLLGTSPAYRQRGIATALLSHLLEDAAAANCRSVIINVDPDEPAAQLYRKLGFTQQVYWQRCYLLPPVPSG